MLSHIVTFCLLSMQPRTNEDSEALLRSHGRDFAQYQWMQQAGGHLSHFVEAPRRQEGVAAVAEVNCGICSERFLMPPAPVVDVTYATASVGGGGAERQRHQLWCCEECVKRRSCWGEVWGMGDDEQGASEQQDAVLE